MDIETATLTIFENVCSFFPRSTFFLDFFRMCSQTTEILTSQEGLCLSKRDNYFPEEVFFCSSNNFFWVYICSIAEQIPIFQKHFFGYYLEQIFSRKLSSNLIEKLGNFPEGTPSEQIF